MGTTYPRVYILDVHGKPVHEPDVECWAEWFSKNENRILRQTDIARNIWVSTVFLGVDHNYTGSGRGPPVLWEKMIFGGRHDQYHQRYTSRPMRSKATTRPWRLPRPRCVIVRA